MKNPDIAELSDDLDSSLYNALRAIDSLKRIQGQGAVDRDDNGRLSSIEGLIQEALSDSHELEGYLEEWEDDYED